MRVLLFILTVGLSLLGASDAMARWLKAETQNFIIYSDGSEKSLREFADNLQRFDATLRFRFKLTDISDPNPLTIFLVQRSRDAGRLATGAGGSSIAGFYSPGSEGSFAVSNRESFEFMPGRGTSVAQQTLFHEYSHHFMRRYVNAAFPAWFVEGFAEYFSTVDFTKDKRAQIGKPAFARAHGLLRLPAIPAEEMFSKRPMELRDGGKIDVYYGRSWLLTHMLYQFPPRSGQLVTYLDAINQGVDAKEAARKHFGDLAQLDKELNDYVKRPLTYWTTNEPIAIPGTITITSLSAAENALLPWRIERLSSVGEDERLVKVRDALTKLAESHVGDAAVWFELAATHWSMTKEARGVPAARIAVEKALAIDPKHVRANVLLGQITAFELDAKGDFEPASWRKVRQAISLANRTQPNDPMPLYAYYRSFVDQGITPPPVAIAGLARAFELAPENDLVRIELAFALANKGEFDRAIKLAQSIAFDPHDRGGGQALLDQLEKMRAKAAGDEENAAAE